MTYWINKNCPIGGLERDKRKFVFRSDEDLLSPDTFCEPFAELAYYQISTLTSWDTIYILHTGLPDSYDGVPPCYGPDSNDWFLEYWINYTCPVKGLERDTRNFLIKGEEEFLFPHYFSETFAELAYYQNAIDVCDIRHSSYLLDLPFTIAEFVILNNLFFL